MTNLKNIGSFLLVFLGILMIAFLSQVGVVSASKTHTIKGELIASRALEFVTGHVPWEPDATEVTIDYRGKDIVVPAGIVDMSFELPSGGSRLGRFPVTVKVKVNNVLRKRFRLTANVIHYSPVVKTRRPINRGKILTEKDLMVEDVPSNRIFSNAMTSLGDVVGKQVIRNLGMGRVVTANSLSKPVLMNKGDRVTLVVERGLMKITAPGIMREKGFKESLVQVLNIQTKKIVYGMVLNSKTVKVNF